MLTRNWLGEGEGEGCRGWWEGVALCDPGEMALSKQKEEIQRPVPAEAKWTGRGCRAGGGTPAGCFESAFAVNGTLNFQVSVMRDDFCAAERRRAESSVP